eukprot:scaffold3046_cov105-Cylindrotheca_fusiformis.AAC.23
MPTSNPFATRDSSEDAPNEAMNIGNNETTEQASASDGISFIITGFGPFGDVPNNPSTILVGELKDYLIATGNEELAARIEQTLVLETSAQDVRKAVDEMATTKTSNKKKIVYLHLGVNYKGTGFKLEQCAYNDATFRIPDQQGYKPEKTVILEDLDLAARCDTTLDLAAVAEKQAMNHSSIETELSTDPGRFVCNYLYCYSLKNLQSELSTCMFLHVPPFEKIAKEAQLAYVADLMGALLAENRQQ